MTFYLRLWINIETYIILLQKITHQMEKEITFRLGQSKIITLNSQGISTLSNYEDDFQRKIRKLRRLYIITVNNFSKFSGRLKYSFTSLILLSYISLIVILGVIAISLKENLHFQLSHYGVMIRFMASFYSIWIKVYSFDRIESCVSIQCISKHYITENTFVISNLLSYVSRIIWILVLLQILKLKSPFAVYL